MGKTIAPKIKNITQEQIKTMKSLEVNIQNVLTRFKISKLEELDFDKAEFVINSKLNANKG